MEILHIYRPAAGSMRAQDVQVIHTAHALARLGHRVTVLADRGPSDHDPLAMWGLEPVQSLDLRVAPTRWRPAAGWWFRLAAARWADSSGRDSVVYAREMKYVQLCPRPVPVVFEAHDCAKMVALDRGEQAGPVEALERATLARAAALVSNCGGTMAALEETYGNALPARRRVIHNATRPDRQVARDPSPTPIVGYTGSPRAYKGLQHVFDSLPRWPGGVELEMVGGAPAGAPSRVVIRPAVPTGELPAIIERYHALLLPLDDNLFGRRLTSPLKLWDYLATGIPIVAADLPTVREIAGDRPFYYQPGNADSLAEAVKRALAAGASPPLLRTWDDRARDIDALLREVVA
ncbi:MAG: glycosyltransferase family 4 protein [Deltaproteobacteria bacterium]|nr:glycosyltransferase family 4 protein [Deltaproteobacteria bacterium]